MQGRAVQSGAHVVCGRPTSARSNTGAGDAGAQPLSWAVCSGIWCCCLDAQPLCAHATVWPTARWEGGEETERFLLHRGHVCLAVLCPSQWPLHDAQAQILWLSW